jgi:hypothetical protein
MHVIMRQIKQYCSALMLGCCEERKDSHHLYLAVFRRMLARLSESQTLTDSKRNETCLKKKKRLKFMLHLFFFPVTALRGRKAKRRDASHTSPAAHRLRRPPKSQTLRPLQDLPGPQPGFPPKTHSLRRLSILSDGGGPPRKRPFGCLRPACSMWTS